MIYDQTAYSRHDKERLKKTHPITLFTENNFEKLFVSPETSFSTGIFSSDFHWLFMQNIQIP